MTANKEPFSLNELIRKTQEVLLACETAEAFEEIAFGLRGTEKTTREMRAIKHAMRKTYKAALKNENADIAFVALQEMTPYYTGEVSASEISPVIDIFVLQDNRPKALAAADWYLGIQGMYGPADSIERTRDRRVISNYRDEIYNSNVPHTEQKFLSKLEEFSENQHFGSLQRAISQHSNLLYSGSVTKLDKNTLQ